MMTFSGEGDGLQNADDVLIDNIGRGDLLEYDPQSQKWNNKYHENGFLSIKDYGAKSDGTTDDTAAIQAAVDAATLGGGYVMVMGSCYITGTINLAAKVILAGRDGESKILVPPATGFPAIKIDGCSATIRNLVIERVGGGARLSGGSAVAVVGNAEHCVVQNITADGMLDTFQVAGQLGSVPGIVKRVVFENCVSLNSSQFGFVVDDSDGVELNSCQSVVSHLDGVKLRRNTKNTHLNGGYFTGATGGDGLDAYAGGDTFTISGGVFSGNTMNGITIKNDDLNKTDDATYGYVRNISISNVKCTDNMGSGLTIHRNGTLDDSSEPLVSNTSVSGGIFNGNHNYGVYVRSRSVTLSGVQCVKNGLSGIEVASAASDVTLLGAHVAGNSQNVSGVCDGVFINGSRRVQIIGGSSIGCAPDGARDDVDLASATPTQRFGIRVQSGSSGVILFGMSLLYNISAQLSDASLASTVLPLYSSNTVDFPSIWMPNNKRLFMRKSDGNLSSAMYLTTGNFLNIGDPANNSGVNLLSSGDVTCFPKLSAQSELEIKGALSHEGTTLGFYGTSPVTRPEITGSRSDGTALANLLSAFEGMGLVVDSTSA